MADIARIETIEEYNNLRGFKTMHPLVAYVEFDGTHGKFIPGKHTMGFYSLFLKETKGCVINYGKTKYDFDSDAMEDYSHKFFRNDENDLGNIQRYDFGLGFLVGAEYANHHSLTFSFDWGLTDMYRDSYRRKHFQEYGVELSKLKNFNAGIT